MIIEEKIKKIISEGWSIVRTGDGYITFEKEFNEEVNVYFLLDIKCGCKHGFYLDPKSIYADESVGENLYDFFTNMGDRK